MATIPVRKKQSSESIHLVVRNQLPPPPRRDDPHAETRHPLLTYLHSILKEAEWWSPQVIRSVFEFAIDALIANDKETSLLPSAVVCIEPNTFLLAYTDESVVQLVQWRQLTAKAGSVVPVRPIIAHPYHSEPQCAYSSRSNTIFKSIPTRHIVRAVTITQPTSSDWSMGKYGSGKDEFNTPLGVCWVRGNKSNNWLYVCDMGNDRLSRIQLNGKDLDFRDAWGVGRLKRPVAVMVTDSAVYVVNSATSCITQFTRNGMFIKSFGQNRLTKPTGIAEGRDGQVLVADMGSGKIHRFLPDGTYDGFYGTGFTETVLIRSGEEEEDRIRSVRVYYNPITLARTPSHLIVNDANSRVPLLFPL